MLLCHRRPFKVSWCNMRTFNLLMDVYLAYVLIEITKKITKKIIITWTLHKYIFVSLFFCSICIKAAHAKTQSCKINSAVPHKCRNSYLWWKTAEMKRVHGEEALRSGRGGQRRHKSPALGGDDGYESWTRWRWFSHFDACLQSCTHRHSLTHAYAHRYMKINNKACKCDKFNIYTVYSRHLNEVQLECNF